MFLTIKYQYQYKKKNPEILPLLVSTPEVDLGQGNHLKAIGIDNV